MLALLEPLASRPRARSTTPPKTPGKAHWVRPRLVAQVRYTEMTDEGRLRHPAYLGLRDDKAAADVTTPRSADRRRAPAKAAAAKASPKPRRRSAAETARRPPSRGAPPATAGRRHDGGSPIRWRRGTPAADAIIAQIDDLEQRRKDGKLTLPDGETLDITNPHKVFWPDGPAHQGATCCATTRASRRCCCRCSTTGRW